MNKKVLVYWKKENLKPVGGPSGYLYNLNKALEKNGAKSIHFIESGDKDRNEEKKTWVKKIINDESKVLKNFKLVLSIIMGKQNSFFDFSKYDVVHFHNTIHLYRNRDNLKNYRGLVLLTSHSPKPLHLEIIEDQLETLLKMIFIPILKKICVIDEFSFSRADYILFPCEEAEEPYSNNWPYFKDIKERKHDSFRYIPTGIEKCNFKKEKSSIRAELGIPENGFVICFVGRHNQTKGYDVLRDIAIEIIKKRDDCYFLIAGKEEPLKGIEDDKWIEIGWTKDPHSYINAADIFILPNKETYFDLIMLEVLSLGKVVLCSDTGGNKYFKKYDKKGIFYYKNKHEAIEQLIYLSELSVEVRNNYGKLNMTLFDENFTTEHFLNDYIKVIDQL